MVIDALEKGWAAVYKRQDLLDQAGQEGFDPALFRQEGAEWFVTPRNVDSEVETLSRVLGLGISTALHVDFSVEDVEKWIS